VKGRRIRIKKEREQRHRRVRLKRGGWNKEEESGGKRVES
jgi:hypothetical protein